MLRVLLLMLTAAVILATLFHCLRTWLGTFGRGLPLSPNAEFTLILLVSIVAAVTVKGRSLLRSVGPIAAVCTVAGVLSLVTLPFDGWPQGSAQAAARSAPRYSTTSRQDHSGLAGPMEISATTPATGTARPNIVILSIDALSAQHMSVYGYSRPTTPMLANFARGAVVFNRAYSNSNFTTPGIASILTGTLPWTHRALQLAVWPRDPDARHLAPGCTESCGVHDGVCIHQRLCRRDRARLSSVLYICAHGSLGARDPVCGRPVRLFAIRLCCVGTGPPGGNGRLCRPIPFPGGQRGSRSAARDRAGAAMAGDRRPQQAGLPLGASVSAALPLCRALALARRIR